MPRLSFFSSTPRSSVTATSNATASVPPEAAAPAPPPAAPAPAPAAAESSVSSSSPGNSSAQLSQQIVAPPSSPGAGVVAVSSPITSYHPMSTQSFTALHIPPDSEIGISARARDSITMQLEDLELGPNRRTSATNPQFLAERIDSLIDIMQEIHITSRDNNAILYQMLFAVEERLMRRIDMVRSEMISMINSKFDQLQQQQIAAISSGASVANSANGSSSNRRGSALMTASKKPSLTKIFEEVEEHTKKDEVILQNIKLVKITPYPGFVIKTRKMLNTREKVFINVFHHTEIVVDPVHLPKSSIADQKPFLLINEVTHTLDKDGLNCETYNVAVSSEYFKVDSHVDLKITGPEAVQKIIHKINIKYDQFLDETNYSLPKLSTLFKGDELPTFEIPVLIKDSAKDTAPPTTTGSSVSAEKKSRGGEHPPASESLLSRDSMHSDNESMVSELTMDVSTTQRRSTGGVRGSAQSIPDNHSDAGSVYSGANSTPTSKHRRIARKSVFDTSQLTINAGNIAGQNMLSPMMVEYVKEECIDGMTADTLRQSAQSNPEALLGWQIFIRSGNDQALCVITGVRKNYLSKTEYR